MGYVEAFARGTWDYCDKCEKPTPNAEGVLEYQDGLAILFFCKECGK